MDNEIELARRAFKEDLDRIQKDAESKIDKLLSKKSMEFCSRCNRKVDDRLEWGGKCLTKGCENLLCDKCWKTGKKRFCSDHKDLALGKEQDGAEKIFFRRKETASETTAQKLESDDQRRNKVENLANNYIDFLKNRLSDRFPDWTDKEYINNSRAEVAIGEEELDATISSKSLLKTKEKLRIFIRPLYGGIPEDVDFILSKLNLDLYSLVILVGYQCSSDVINYVKNYNNNKVSLFLVEPLNNLIYSDNKSLTNIYSQWFDSKKKTVGLIEILKKIAEKVSGRYTVTVEKVAEEFGLSESDTLKFLESCKFLEPVEDTTTFFFK